MGPNLSVLLAIFPGVRRPTEEETVARLSPFYRSVVPASCEGCQTGWSQGWRSPEGDQHLLSLQAFDPEWIDVHLSLSHLTRREAKAARSARWALWCATELDPDEPLASYARQLRLVSIAAPEAVAFHDPASQRVLSAERLRAIASWATPPPPSELYQLHAVTLPGPTLRERRGGVWLHTHGLERSGMPDVELFRVPSELLDPASDLVSAFVRARLGTTVPLRGSSDDLVLGHRVSWVPAEEAARRVPSGELGGMADRRPRGGDSSSHAGPRIVLVADARFDAHPEAPPDPPIEILRAFEDASAVVRVRPSEAERAAQLARERWHVFEALFAAHGSDLEWSFAVNVPLHTASGGSEFLWWVVEEIREGRVRCRVRNEVLDVPGLRSGEERWHEASALEDWVVYAPNRDVTPATVAVPA